MDRPPDDVPNRDRSERVRRLVAECVERYPVEGEVAVDALCAANPDDAEAVRERISRLGRAGLLDAPGRERERIPERLGEFRLERRLGIGGMGVVYLAEQESLGRKVALKLVRPELLYFPGARERFRREVEAIARLADPGIVPIHAVGEDGGIPYFAMGYVEGATLAAALAVLQGRDPAGLTGADLAAALGEASGIALPDTLPDTFRGSWPATCARVVRQMATALHHAHERGVIHRDVKPSNAICTPAGDVLMLDFGLAATAGSTRVTRSGAQVGTPYCMAPEQLLETTVDARTDVYALGVTLFELLTLRAPFESPSNERLRAEILVGLARAPSKLNHEVPRDLDVMCGKAMDRDVGRRYPTALALADDLDLFLSHRPISARPSGAWLRSRRWARRHPGVATALTVLPLVVLGGYQWLDARRESTRLETELSSSLGSALNAIERMIEQSRDGTLENTPGLDKTRAAQLESALAILRALHADHPDRPRLTLALTRGLARAAILHDSFGQYDRADAAVDEGLALLARVPLGVGSPGERGATEATLFLSQGHVRLVQGRHEDAVHSWQLARERFAAIAESGPLPVLAIRDYASCLTNLALMARTHKDLATAATLLTEAMKWEAQANAVGARTADVKNSIRLRTDLAVVTMELGKRDEARDLMRAILDDTERLVASESKDPEVLRENARAAVNLARAESVAREFVTSAERLEAAAQRFGQIADSFPDRVNYAWERDMTELEAARGAVRARRTESALAWYAAAVGHHEELVKRLPGRLELVNELSEMQRSYAGTLAESGREEEASALLERAATAQATIVAKKPDDPIWSRQLAFILAQRGMLSADRDAAAARLHFTAAIERFDSLRSSPAGEPTDTSFEVDCLRRLAHCALGSGDRAAALEALKRSQELQPQSADQLESLGRELDLNDDPAFRELVESARHR